MSHALLSNFSANNEILTAQLEVSFLSHVNPERGAGGHDETPQSALEKPFDQLVLPRGHKELVVSLISQHFRNKESAALRKKQTDIIRGKGNQLFDPMAGLSYTILLGVV